MLIVDRRSDGLTDGLMDDRHPMIAKAHIEPMGGGGVWRWGGGGGGKQLES